MTIFPQVFLLFFASTQTGMVNKCWVLGCRSNYRRHPEEFVPVHRFPSNPELLEKWTRFCRRESAKPSKHSVICTLHFLPSDYKSDPRVPYTRKQLLPNSVPSVFNPSSDPSIPSYLDVSPSKKRRTPAARGNKSV